MRNEPKEINCLQCDKLIDTAVRTTWGTFRHDTRNDKHFCSGACKAAYHRVNEQPQIHADLERDIILDCAVCGGVFRINDYANRTGQRLPLYCSNRCKQKAYRERKKSAAYAMPGLVSQEGRNASVWACQTPDCGQRRFVEPMGDKCDYCGGSDWKASLSF